MPVAVDTRLWSVTRGVTAREQPGLALLYVQCVAAPSRVSNRNHAWSRLSWHLAGLRAGSNEKFHSWLALLEGTSW